jgi:uncharacterized membrane protein YoaT (DUF817 family)
MNIIKNFIYFWLKQANAAIFWILLIIWIAITNLYYPIDFISRNDFLFLYAICIQILLVLLKIETLKEVKIIFIFHFVATILEIFKTNMWSWEYIWDGFFMIQNVPLFTGFMYSAVWSYMMRVWRLFDFQFSHFPKLLSLNIFVLFVYINFFSHHYIYDFRYILLFVSLILFYKSIIYFKVNNKYLKMPLLIWFFLVWLFIWFAENIATFYSLWQYPNQENGWELVSFHKILAWYLLMLLSFCLVTLVQKIKIFKQ